MRFGLIAGVVACASALACAKDAPGTNGGASTSDDAPSGAQADAASREMPSVADAATPEPACVRDEALLHAIDDATAFADRRVRATIAFLQAKHPSDYATYFPAVTIPEGQPGAGEWDLSPRGSPVISSRASDWRSGYFPGTLYEIYRLTGASDLLAFAREWTASLEPVASIPLDHDLGQRFERSFGEELDVATDANDPSGALRTHARDVLFRAARTLDSRFAMNGAPIAALRALDDWPPGPYPVYVDSMVNAPLLFDAHARAGAARTLYDHGVLHAATVLRDHVRANGSSYHIVQYGDGTYGTKKDGALFAKISDQGYAAESTWSRGQAWGLYGFTAVYRHTRGDPAASPERFRDAAERMAEYFLAHLPAVYGADAYDHRAEDFVPPADFDAALGEPSGPYNDANGDGVRGDRKPGRATFTQRDSSAGAIAASALLELGTFASTPAKRAAYLTGGARILRALLTYRDAAGRLVYLAEDSVHRGVLANAANAWSTPDVSLIYGDFHLLEAIRRYRALRCPPVVSPGE